MPHFWFWNTPEDKCGRFLELDGWLISEFFIKYLGDDGVIIPSYEFNKIDQDVNEDENFNENWKAASQSCIISWLSLEI